MMRYIGRHYELIIVNVQNSKVQIVNDFVCTNSTRPPHEPANQPAKQTTDFIDDLINSQQ